MSESNIITQENFVSSPYVDESWEVIGDPPGEKQFQAFEVQVISSEQFQRDPMFRDFGGLSDSKSTMRWHLPSDAAESQAPKEEEQDLAQRLTDEQIEQIRAEAFSAGIEEAKSQAEALRAEEIAAIGTKMEEIIRDLQKQFSEQLQAIEKAALNLTLDMGEKLVGHAVEINPEYIIKIIQDALKQTGGANIKRVRVSPEDMEFIEVVGIRDKIGEIVGGWQFESDPTIRSGCVVDSSSGEIDYQLDKAWNRLRDSILKVRG